MTRQTVWCTIALAAVTASVAGAQGNPPPPRPDGQGRGGQRAPGDSMQARPNRLQLEQRFRNRLAAVAKRQLNLTDAQVEKLQKTTQRLAERRRLMMEQERDVRMSLRDELISGDSTRQKQVGDLLDRMVKVQRQRVDLLDEEQKDLATFLTPIQRAKYFGLEEDLRRRLDEMRAQRMGGPGAGGAGMGGRMGGGRGAMIRRGPPGEDSMPPGGPPAQGQLRPRRPGGPDGPPNGPPDAPPIKP